VNDQSIAVDSARINSTLILIPVFNNQAALDFTLASLVGTDAHDAAVLVVDDGSAVALVARPRLKGVRIKRLDRNVGIASALNEGLRLARAEGYAYVLRLDAGDGYIDGRLSRQFEFLNAHPDVAIVGSAAEYFYPQTGGTITYVPPLDHQSILRRLRYHNPIVHPSIMMRLDALEDNYSTRYPASEDYELYLRVSGKWRLANVPECLCRYEVNSGSISALRRKRQLMNGIRLKLKYFDWGDRGSYIGLVENIVRYAMPSFAARLLSKLKNGQMPSRW